MIEVTYQREQDLSAVEFIDILCRSRLSERRPIHEAVTIEKMLSNADIIVTARSDRQLVGVSRAITDFAYCTYLSDLAVDCEVQSQGIGRTLIQKTHQIAGLGSSLILLSAPTAASYYPHIGMTSHQSCWITARLTQDEATTQD